MTAIKHRTLRFARMALRALVVTLVAGSLLLAPPAAMAQKKKKEEEARPQKSYVLPYMIVMMLLGVGLMTVCRPGSRKDKVDDRKRQQEP